MIHFIKLANKYLRNPEKSQPCFTVDHTPPRGQSGVTQVKINSQFFGITDILTPFSQETCAEVGPWLGAGDNITVVDTPGFGGDMEEEEDTIDGLVNFLRYELKYVDAFVIAFRQSDNRPTVAYKTMIKLIDGIFGDELWNHVMIEATWWSYSQSDIRRRGQKQLTEDSWLKGAPLTSLDNIVSSEQREKIAAVFIDTFYEPEDPTQKEKFEENTQALKDFTQNKTSFHCKDISIVKTELRELEEQRKRLEEEKIRIQTQKNELEESCSNENFKLRRTIEFQTNETKLCQDDRKMITAEKLSIEDRVIDDGMLAGILAGVGVAGLLLGALFTVLGFKNFKKGKCEDDDDGDSTDSESSEKEMIENAKSKKKSVSSFDNFTDLDSNIETFNKNIKISKV